MRSFPAPSLRAYFSKDQGELPARLKALFASQPDEIVQPATTDEAADAVRRARHDGAAVVPRGAGSSAFGQVVPMRRGRVLDVCFIKRVVRLDASAREVTVEAGVRWSDLSAYLDEQGLALGSYPSSWYTTVGGWISTGGLGLNTLKFGPIRAQTVRLRVCTPEGEDRVFEAGEALFEAFFESEGQMGLILEATLKVRPKPEGSFPCLVPCGSAREAWELTQAAIREGFDLTHASVFNAERLHHFNHTLRASMERKGSDVAREPVFQETASALFHVETQDEHHRLYAWLLTRGKPAAPAFQSSYVWMERFYPLKGKRADQSFLGSEVVVPDASCAALYEELEALARAAGVSLAIEANSAGEGRSVVIASFYAPREDEAAFVERLALVLELDEAGVRRGGRPYHVGIYNTHRLSERFPAERLKALKAAKARLDPAGRFNPGKFFELKPAALPYFPSWLNILGARMTLGLLRFPGVRALLHLSLPPSGGAGPKALRGALPSLIEKAAGECVSCGFCLPICPAYLATQDERTTARGKLFLAQTWLAGGELSGEDVERLHSCMHCAGCTRVCQSTIDLVPVWRELEAQVGARHGKPVPAIEAFVKDVEASADYKRLLRKGYITENGHGSQSFQV